MLRSRLREIASHLDEELDPAFRRAAEAIAADAKGRVPVSTGALRDAIHVERVGDTQYAVVAGDGDVFYGHMVENGTTYSSPRPFLIPALEAERHRIPKRAADELKDI